jgi:hypothetical protein
VTVMRWVQDEEKKLEEPTVSETSTSIILDEMGHFVNGKKFGSGKPTINWKSEWWPGNWVVVMLKLYESFCIGLESKSRNLSPMIPRPITSSFRKTSFLPEKI